MASVDALPARGEDRPGQQRVARVSDGLRYVAAWNAAFLPSKDLAEGLQSTFEKRKPEFTGD
jgi:enoyl-CoA hydratase